MKTMTIVLGAGMRVFFLTAALFSLLAMGVWESWLVVTFAGGAPPDLPVAPPLPLWHAHEMIFGYACAVLAGFFLTAVPAWTGERSARTGFVTLLAALWLAGRLAVWGSGGLGPVPVAILDLAFLPALGTKIALQIVRRPKPQNVLFIGLIALVWLGNLMVHLDWTGVRPGIASNGLRLGLLGIAAMIATIGGRVIPAFTRNAMLRSGRESGLPTSRRPAETAGIASAIALPLFVAADAPDLLVAATALAAALAQAVRISSWRWRWTLGQPILWSLHLGFAMLALGYLALGVAYAGLIDPASALHLLGIGAIGGMTLAMMSRAALGHTGRALVVSRPTAWAYRLVAASALLRFLGQELPPDLYGPAVLVSGALWILAFGLFLSTYWLVLTGPRQSEQN